MVTVSGKLSKELIASTLKAIEGKGPEYQHTLDLASYRLASVRREGLRRRHTKSVQKNLETLKKQVEQAQAVLAMIADPDNVSSSQLEQVTRAIRAKNRPAAAQGKRSRVRRREFKNSRHDPAFGYEAKAQPKDIPAGSPDRMPINWNVQLEVYAL